MTTSTDQNNVAAPGRDRLRYPWLLIGAGLAALAVHGRIHTRKAAIRAVENGYSLVRQDRHGLSAAFDPRGRVLATADAASTDPQVMIANVPTRGVQTGYVIAGDVFGWVCVAGLVLCGPVAAARRRRSGRLRSCRP